MKCPFPGCDTKIIPFTKKLYETNIIVNDAPGMISTESKEASSEEPPLFYKVEDVWDFDNVGVSRPSAGMAGPKIGDEKFNVERLLVCSECDRGPIGFAGVSETQNNTHENLRYFVSCNSVLYE